MFYHITAMNGGFRSESKRVRAASRRCTPMLIGPRAHTNCEYQRISERWIEAVRGLMEEQRTLINKTTEQDHFSGYTIACYYLWFCYLRTGCSCTGCSDSGNTDGWRFVHLLLDTPAPNPRRSSAIFANNGPLSVRGSLRSGCAPSASSKISNFAIAPNKLADFY